MRPAAALALSLAAAFAPLAASACTVEDSFTGFLALAQRTRGLAPAPRLAAFDAEILPGTAGLYTEQVVGLGPGEKLDAAIEAAMAKADVAPSWADYDARLQRAVPDAVAKFTAAFPDFRCDFTIYIAPTLQRMDAGGRMVDGRPALVFGPDTIAGLETPEQLPVLFAHELFHRHHGRVAGFSDEDPEGTPIWRTLWTEGLATYVSARLNPDRTLREALLQPGDLEHEARPVLPRLAGELAANLDRTDAALAHEYFMYGDAAAKAHGVPWRSGYYVGYLVACDLGRTRSLSELAHMQGEPLRRAIAASLARMAKTRA